MRHIRRIGWAGLVLVLAFVVAGCAQRPLLVRELTGLPVDATNIEVHQLDNPDFEQIDWWEVHYTTARPKETVDAVRHFLINAIPGAVDDANTGYGFTIADSVDVHEVFTTDRTTTKIVVRVRSETVDGYVAIDD